MNILSVMMEYHRIALLFTYLCC